MHCLANIIQETTEVLLGGLLGSFSETEPIRYRERHKRFTISIGSHSYGGWEIHHLLLASWRPKEYCHSSQRPDKCTSSECEGRRKPMLQFISHAERENSLFLYPFGLFRPSLDWIMLTHIGEGNESVHQFKCSVHQFKYWCLLKTSSQNPGIMFKQISGHMEWHSQVGTKFTII